MIISNLAKHDATLSCGVANLGWLCKMNACYKMNYTNHKSLLYLSFRNIIITEKERLYHGVWRKPERD